MKKVIVLTLAVLLLASSGFATELAADVANKGKTLHATTPAGQDISKLSTGVYAGAAYSSTGYSIATFHMSGTKAYGTAYDATAIYWSELGAGGTLTAPTSSAADEAFAGWTVM
jgi:hypothetical protein